MLAALPREETYSWGEKLVVPLILWSIFAFLPLRLARRLNSTSLVVAIGQFMLFRRSAYDQIGGYADVRSNPVDDLALARKTVAKGLQLSLVDAGRRVRCRMYRDFSESYAGLSRSLFAAFDYKTGLFALVWSWIVILFLEPLVVLSFRLAGLPVPDVLTHLAFLGVCLALLLWGIFCKRFKYPVYLAWLYPVVVLLSGTIAARSIYLALQGRVYWKGRKLPAINR